MIAELKRSVAHDAAAEAYRAPLGALPGGSRVRLAITVHSASVLDARLVVFGDAYQQELAMARDGDIFSAVFPVPERPMVLWYYFTLHVYDSVYYYGMGADGRAMLGDVYQDRPPAFQLTVYDRDFVTPRWFCKSVLYQIFPDRFAPGEPPAVAAGAAYHRSLGREIRLHAGWDEPVDYLPRPGALHYAPDDFYGGTLNAIRARLPYLHELGVSALYLNPIFEAGSNHRYDTADYHRVDPLLGSNEDFQALCTDAAALGMRVLLDGVFSHTGADSVYFNKYGRYESLGAYQSPDSPYAAWYAFRAFPDDYRCWWGFESLPEVDEHDPGWQDFIISGQNSVVRRWLRAGAAGFRLDVADELPDDVLALLRRAVKEEDAENVVLGEVWEDPTTKHSYGARRSYALGNALDSVMNYPLRDAIVDFLLSRRDAYQFAAFLRHQRLNYPPPLYYALMNLLSSHDIERVRSALACRLDARTLSRPQQASFVINDAQDARGAVLQKLAVAIQFSLPGTPCVYYGDEQGMQGFLDPFNRAPFQTGPHPLVEWYAWWAHLRQREDALSTGAVALFAPHADVLCILRHCTDQDVFGAPAKPGCLLTVVNRAAQPRRFVADFYRPNLGLTAGQCQALRSAAYTKAECLLGGEIIPVDHGLLFCQIPARGAACYYLT